MCDQSPSTAVSFSSQVSGTTYAWTNDLPSIGLGANGTGDLASFTASNTSSAPVTAHITVTPTANNCTGTPLTFTITVNPTATVNAVSNQTLCDQSPSTAVSFSSPVSGTTYAWTNDLPSIGLGANGTGDLASFTASNTSSAPVTAHITVTPTANNCTGTPLTFTITVNPTATVNAVSDQTLCDQSPSTAVSFSSPVSGTTYAWTNDLPSIGLGANGTGDLASFTASNTSSAPVTAHITVTPTANNCTGTPLTFTITVNPTATVNAVSNQTLCDQSPSTAVSFSSQVSGTTYAWTNDLPSIGLGANGTGDLASFTASNTSSAPVTAHITVTPTANNCTGTPLTFTITVNPTATVNTVSDQTLCDQSPSTAVSFSSPVSGTTYAWTNDLPSIGLGANGTGDLASFTASNASSAPVTAHITVTPTANNCTGTPLTFTITVNPTATVNAVSDQTLCDQSPSTAVSFSSPVSGTTYAWTNDLPSIGLGANGTGDLASFTASNTSSAPVTAHITVTPTANNCTGTPLTFTITVNPTATVNAVSNQTLCDQSPSTAVSFSSQVSGTTYAWTNDLPSIGLGANGTGDLASFTASNTSSAPVTAHITVTPTANNCTGTPLTFTITVNPLTSQPIVGPNQGPLNATQTSLSADQPSVGTGQWSQTAGPSTAAYDPTDRNTPVSNLIPGTYVFTWTITGFCDPTSRDVRIIINAPPLTHDGTNTTNEDVPVTGTLTPGNSDPDGDPLTYGPGTPPTHGTVDINPDGSYTYTPDPNYNGPDQFTYNVCDNNGACTPATIDITVNPVNDPPIANNGTNTTNEDTPATGTLTPGNSDPDGDPLTYTPGTPPTHGTVDINPDGSYTYTPDPNYNGPDQFTYNVCDNNGACTPATINIIVTPVNDPPVANNGNNTTNEDTPVTGTLTPGNSDPDGDPLTYNPGTPPTHGTVTINPDGSYTYTPDPNYNGPDQFTYNVCDNNRACTPATVTINVNPVNDPPVANNGNNTTDEDTPVTGTLTPGNSDPDGDPLTYTPGTPPTHGTVTINPDGSYTYTPDPNYNGPDQFTYNVCDNNGACMPAIVDIIVTPVNDSPVANNGNNTTDEDTPVAGDLTPGNSDPDGDPLTYSPATPPSHGTVTINPDGSYVYTPSPDYYGPDEFTYQVCDSQNSCTTSTVPITVDPVAIISLTPAKSEVLEGFKTSVYAKLDKPVKNDVIARLKYGGDAILQGSTNEQGAVRGNTDYQLQDNYQTILIPAGKTRSSQKLTVYALADNIKELDELVLPDISGVVSKSTIIIGAGAQVTIKDVTPEKLAVIDEISNPDILPDPYLSPNGDGQGNEVFTIRNINKYPDNEVFIYNRWGNEIFKIRNYDNDLNSFRGRANTGILTNTNEDLVDGVYYYVIYTRTGNNDRKMNKGYIILKRK